MLPYLMKFFEPSRFNIFALQEPTSLCLVITFLLCTDLHEVIFMAALIGLHQIFPAILRILLEPASAKHIYSILYHNSKTDIIVSFSPYFMHRYQWRVALNEVDGRTRYCPVLFQICGE